MSVLLAVVLSLGGKSTLAYAVEVPDQIITGDDVLEDSQSGQISSFQTSATISTDALETVATTIFPVGGGEIKVEAKIYYWFGQCFYATRSGVKTAAAGGVSATATRALGGAEVTGGYSTHSIKWSSYTWSPSLEVGYIPNTIVLWY